MISLLCGMGSEVWVEVDLLVKVHLVKVLNLGKLILEYAIFVLCITRESKVYTWLTFSHRNTIHIDHKDLEYATHFADINYRPFSDCHLTY